MRQQPWQEILLTADNEDQIWELFHENSKIRRYSSSGLSDEEVVERMSEFHESLDFVGQPAIELPHSVTPLRLSLQKAIIGRVSAREMVSCPLSLEGLAALLHYSYGVTRDNKGTSFPRPFRVVPSGGALYPLEIFFHSAHIKGLKAGLYHYNPSKNHLRLLHAGDETTKIADAMVQPEIARGAPLILFITAIFERSVFKYEDRGYRFTLLEAGHVAQNINLVANALGLGSLNIGGYYDREIDELLGLDGVTHSTIYIVAVGKRVRAIKLNK